MVEASIAHVLFRQAVRLCMQRHAQEHTTTGKLVAGDPVISKKVGRTAKPLVESCQGRD